MASDGIIRYDEEFIGKFEKLGEVIETGDRPFIHRFLIDNFGFLFTAFQHRAKEIEGGSVPLFDAADEETKRELMRPLSYRQYRLTEGSFSVWKEEEEDVIASIWDFLSDDGRIYEKKVMSSAELCACSMILEQVYVCLARK